MLSRLLNSTNPDDLRAANKLIKEMVQEVCHHIYVMRDYSSVPTCKFICVFT